MKVVRQSSGLPLRDRGAVVAIGNFDGVHLGHRAVIEVADRQARALGVQLGVIVFEPHPREFFKPGAENFRLTPLPAKSRLLGELGVDLVYALPFDTEMAARLAPEFALDVLVGELGILHAVVGQDFRFGRSRSGDATALAYIGEMEGFGVQIVPPVKGSAGLYSSSRVRDFLRHGKPREAAELLGRPWSIQGRVRPGDQVGRSLGVPTANLALDGYLCPALGIYAARVDVFSGKFSGKSFEGMAYIGSRPTFGKTEIVLEANLFDFSGDLYGAEIAVSLIEFLRYDEKFDSPEALQAQMRDDERRARAVFASPNEPTIRRP